MAHEDRHAGWQAQRLLDEAHMAASFRHFAALHDATIPTVCDVMLDLTYGPHDRHRLDLYRPDGLLRPLPTLIFVHGGGFVGGNRQDCAPAFWGNVGRWVAARGWLGVVMSYRLAPAFRWPSGAEDLARAHAWLLANATKIGVDPGAVLIVGQSAGAAHVAGYLAGHGDGIAGPVAGAALISGLYDPAQIGRNRMNAAYYGALRDWGEASALPGLVASDVPMLIVEAEFDPEDFRNQAAQLCATLGRSRAGQVRRETLAGHDHLSGILALGLPKDEGLATCLSDFMQSCINARGTAAKEE